MRHEPEREGQRTDTSACAETLTADRLILSAGSLGSTFLLLKMKTWAPSVASATSSAVAFAATAT